MDKTKDGISTIFNNNDKYERNFEIIDRKYEMQLHWPLHAAAHFLIPNY